MIETEVYLTPAQIAQILQLNIITIYHYIKTGELPAFKIGKSYRVEEKAFKSFIAKKQLS